MHAEPYRETGEDFEDWLAGPEADGSAFSEEYLAMSNLVQAYEYARVTLKQRRAGDGEDRSSGI